MNVIAMKPVPNAEMVSVLRELLGRAESGDLHGAAFVLLGAETSVQTGWAGIVGQNPNATLGGVALLQARLVSSALEAQRT